MRFLQKRGVGPDSKGGGQSDSSQDESEEDKKHSVKVIEPTREPVTFDFNTGNLFECTNKIIQLTWIL